MIETTGALKPRTENDTDLISPDRVQDTEIKPTNDHLRDAKVGSAIVSSAENVTVQDAETNDQLDNPSENVVAQTAEFLATNPEVYTEYENLSSREDRESYLKQQAGIIIWHSLSIEEKAIVRQSIECLLPKKTPLSESELENRFILNAMYMQYANFRSVYFAIEELVRSQIKHQ